MQILNNIPLENYIKETKNFKQDNNRKGLANSKEREKLIDSFGLENSNQKEIIINNHQLSVPLDCNKSMISIAKPISNLNENNKSSSWHRNSHIMSSNRSSGFSK